VLAATSDIALTTEGSAVRLRGSDRLGLNMAWLGFLCGGGQRLSTHSK
jgi:hypothetical protein